MHKGWVAVLGTLGMAQLRAGGAEMGGLNMAAKCDLKEGGAYRQLPLSVASHLPA